MFMTGQIAQSNSNFANSLNKARKDRYGQQLFTTCLTVIPNHYTVTADWPCRCNYRDFPMTTNDK